MKKLLFILLIAASFGLGCGPKHSHPADVAATYILPFDKTYQIAEHTLLTLHDFCAALGENCPAKLKPIVTNWNKIDDINDKISATVDKIHATWLDVARLKTPENEKQLQDQLRLLTELLNDLLNFLPSDSQTGIPAFDELYAGKYQAYVTNMKAINLEVQQ